MHAYMHALAYTHTHTHTHTLTYTHTVSQSKTEQTKPRTRKANCETSFTLSEISRGQTGRWQARQRQSGRTEHEGSVSGLESPPWPKNTSIMLEMNGMGQWFTWYDLLPLLSGYLLTVLRGSPSKALSHVLVISSAYCSNGRYVSLPLC